MNSQQTQKICKKNNTNIAKKFLKKINEKENMRAKKQIHFTILINYSILVFRM